MINFEKLSKKETGEILYKLCLAVSETKNSEEAAEFLQDLLSYKEIEMIAKRLKIAEMLMGDYTYDEISKNLKVGTGKIARVHEWLKISGEGYKKAVTRTKDSIKERKKTADRSNWSSIKRRYPMYYWPEILLENIIKNANNRQKEKIKSVLRQMEKNKEKTQLYKKLKKMIG